MNHDATHCNNYSKDCPATCYRARLTKELYDNADKFKGMLFSFADLRGTDECEKEE